MIWVLIIAILLLGIGQRNMPRVPIHAMGNYYAEAEWDGTGIGRGGSGIVFVTHPVVRITAKSSAGEATKK